MAATLKSALPAHLKQSKPSGLGNGDAANAEFARKHHGKTQSHMVSEYFLPSSTVS
jgi:UTP--glucose-1-phosphate uridylyltransferase